ncbi:Uncharacterized protein HZ326_1343, partial [Fusarium oxysporum f. sp. albedinis]
MMEYGRDNEQHARDTIGRVHSRYLLFPSTLSISAHRPDHDHLDCLSFPQVTTLSLYRLGIWNNGSFHSSQRRGIDRF